MQDTLILGRKYMANAKVITLIKSANLWMLFLSVYCNLLYLPSILGHLNSLPYLLLSLNKYNLLPDVMSKRCWMSGKIVDPDEMPHSAASHQGLQCLLKTIRPKLYGKFEIWAFVLGRVLELWNIWSLTMLDSSWFFFVLFFLCWGFTAQSTQWGHVERGDSSRF